MEYTAFNHLASISLHSIGIYCAAMHGIHCIQSESIAPRCIVSTAFNGDPFSHAAWYTLRSIRMHFTTLHGLHCIQSRCMESTEFNRDALGLAAWTYCIQSRCINSPAFNRVPFLHAALNTLHSIMLQGIHGIQTGCILPGCMESTAFNHTAWNPLHSIRMHFTRLHGVHCIQ